MKSYVYNFVEVNKNYLENQPVPICMKNLTDTDMFEIAKEIYNEFHNYGYKDGDILEFYHRTIDDDIFNDMDDLYLSVFEKSALKHGAYYY